MKALLLRFLPSLMGGWQLYALAAAALVVVLLGLRMHWIQAGREEILRENATAATRIVEKQGAVTTKVITKYVQVAGETQKVTEYVDREVIKYAEVNPGLCLDVAFRVLHDTAAANALPGSPSRTNIRLRASAAPPGGLRQPDGSPGAGDDHPQLPAPPPLR